MSKKTIRERRAEQERDKIKSRAVTYSDFLIDWKRNPMIAIGLGGSAFLTALMGLAIGLNPRLNELGVIELFGGQTGGGAAFIGIFFGVIYMVAFPVLGEYGTYYWHRKLSLRDEGNHKQTGIAFVTMLLAASFTVTTAVSASYILATLLHTFSIFNAIPDWVQYWTILIIPIALTMHAGANMAYDHFSEYAADRRAMERELQETEVEAENQVRQARIDARKRAAMTMADEYERISSTEAVQAGKNLARTAWRHDKEALGGDDDGDGIPNAIDPDYNPESAYVPEPVSRGNGHGQTTFQSDEQDFTNPPK